ncbi:sugar ABC transporter substrate-binding protein [Paenibacillus urinalis]|uniref:Sugar ABC transporter substrate-binding protein n=1 Tax=Paenibacillus urinalis TaxID=521520 RepID=A0ABY7X9W6_9BACL|nr:sugar ABC transporter substrate-binding protein [Paenibacillus urinalis]WDI02602.1 sugar ABC transporter substrate-binding protein [Paenibacillus urinalis]
MVKRKKVSVLVCMLLVFSVFAAACSGGGTNGGSEGAGTDPDNNGGTSQEEVAITLGYYSDGKSDAKMKELIEKFTAKFPHIKVDTQSAPYGQFYQKLDTQIAAGKAPDVWLSDGALVMKYAERGTLKDVTEWIDRDLNKDDYYGLEFNKDADGRYWGIPQGIQIGVLYYNKDLFDKAGVEYPTEEWSWEDLKTTATQLTVDGSGKAAAEEGFDTNTVSQFGLTFFSITEGWFTVLKSYGGGILDETGTQSIVDSDGNKEAMNWIVDGMQKGIFTDPVDLKSFQSAMAVFPSGSAAMRIGIYARVQAANEAGLNYDVTVLPTGPDGKRFAPVIANSWVISAKADEAKAAAAWEWMKFWATEDEVQKEWAALGEAVPVKKSVANSDVFLTAGEKPENRQAFLDSFEFAGTLDTNAVWEEWVSKFNENAERAFLGDATVDESLTKANGEIQDVLDAFYEK